MLGFGLLATIQPLFLYWARCVELFSGDQSTNSNSTINATELCARLSKNNTLQDIVERDISTWSIYMSLGSHIPTLITAPLLGAWADSSGGRKKPLIISIIGFTLHGIMQVVATFTYKTQSVYIWLFLSGVLSGCCGGFMTMFATCFTIVTDDSRNDLTHGPLNSNIPVRVGIATALHMFSSTMGGVLASIITSLYLDERSYILASSCGTLFMLGSLLYAILFVRETHQPNVALLEKSDDGHQSTRVCELCVKFCAGIGEKCTSFIRVLVEKRESWTRLCLNLSLFFVFVEVLSEPKSLLLLIVKRPPFEWSDSEWTNYSIIRGCTYAVGMIVWPVLIARTNWLGKDSILIIGGVFSAAVISILLAFAQDNTILYLCAGLAVFFGASSPGFRTFLPRLVRPEETARLMTAFGVVISLCPIVSSLIFNTIFNATLNVWPGLIFLIAGILMVAVSAGQCFVHLLMRPLWKEKSSAGFEPLVNEE
uniref:Uncharacterized protein n=1 Tax=Plectus sambesii TaxID=2011161 RepID=A0A914X6W4_9BILA